MAYPEEVLRLALEQDDLSDTQREYISLHLKLGSIKKVADEKGKSIGTVGNTISRVLNNLSRTAPATDTAKNGAPPGFLMRHAWVKRDEEGQITGTSEFVKADDAQRVEAIKSVIDGLCERLPSFPPISAPEYTQADLITKYVITDYHVGAYAWHEESGDDWDLAIAERLLDQCFGHLVDMAPPSKTAFIAQLGDFLDYDGMLPVTPTNRHVLDVDGRFAKVVDVAIECIISMVNRALAKHENVVLLCAEGNHDESSSIWLRAMFKRLYADNPRVEVIDTPSPYYVYEFGQNMFCFHHGHKSRRENLPLLFASRYPEVWGRTRHRTCDTGHYHHEKVDEKSGMKLFQHPTLAAANAHSARGGWDAVREASAITYHRHTGRKSAAFVSPEVL